jgi:predicted RNase H-like HicB family nuclease
MGIYRYPMAVEQAKRNLSAYIPGLDGIITTGKTLDDIRKNMKEALSLHLETMLEDGDDIPDPLTTEQATKEYKEEFSEPLYAVEYVEVEVVPYTDQLLSDLRDSKGAALFLADRARKERPDSTRESYAVETIHNLVRTHRLPAYVFSDEGKLIPHYRKESRRAGQALFFTVHDLKFVDLPNDNPGKPRKKKEAKK